MKKQIPFGETFATIRLVPVATHETEREFLKLLTGLNTGVIGALFYALEHLVHSKASRAFFVLTLLAFVVSLVACLFGMRFLIDLEHIYSREPLEVVSEQEDKKLLKRSEWWTTQGFYNRSLILSFLGFCTGVFFAVFLILENLKQAKVTP